MLKDGYCICFNEWSLDTRIKNELPLLLIISSLCAKTGSTFASNKYFAELFNCTEVSVSQKINKLIELGYIQADYQKRGCEVKSRKIRLKKFLTDDSKDFYPTIKKVFKDNNNSIVNNNTILMNSNIKEAMEKWVAYKRERKQKYTPTGLKQCFEKLKKLSNDNPVIAMQIVDESISNNWSGLFPLKKTAQQTKSERINQQNLDFLQKSWGL